MLRSRLSLAVLAFLLSVQQAFAFHFGYVRVSDSLDLPLGVLFALSLVFMAGVWLTKPSGLPFSQVRNAKKYGIELSEPCKILFVAFGFSYSVLMVLFFIGMVMRSASEFTGECSKYVAECW